MPHWVEQGGCTTTHAALRAGLHRGLEVLVERNTAGVERFTAANWATQRTNAASVNADTCALRNVFHDSAGGGVDGVEAVTTLDQHARTELARRGTHAGHDWRWQRDLEGRNGVVETFDIVQTGFARVAREQAGGDQNVEELSTFINFAGHTVLRQVFTFQLLNRGIGEIHITPVVNKTVHLLELFSRVVFQQ